MKYFALWFFTFPFISCDAATRVERTPDFTPSSPFVNVQSVIKQEGLDLVDDVPFTGTVTDQYSDGQLSLRRGSREGRAHGVWIEWYASGQLRYYGEWSEGRGHETFLYFHENGELRERATVHADIWDGVAEGWTPKGSKSFERLYHNGEIVHDKRLETETG